MNVWIFVLLFIETAAQTPENDKVMLLSVKRNSKKKANKKNKKKNKTGNYGNNYAPPPKIPFAPEPVYNYPTPLPPKVITIPSPSPPRQLGCWHCDAPSMEECQKIGMYKTCPHNAQSCMIETRKRNGLMEQVCMGCKEYGACQANRRQNFTRGRYGQCRPDVANGPSVCRQCCLTDSCTRNFNPDSYMGWLKGPQ